MEIGPWWAIPPQIRISFSGPAAPQLAMSCAPESDPAPAVEGWRGGRALGKDNLMAGRSPSVDRACQGRRPRSEAWLNADPARGRRFRKEIGAKTSTRAAHAVRPLPPREAQGRWLVTRRRWSGSFRQSLADQSQGLPPFQCLTSHSPSQPKSLEQCLRIA